MQRSVDRLQRNVGLGGALTFAVMLVLGVPYYLGFGQDRTFADYVVDDNTISLAVVLVIFICTAVSRSKASRVLQLLLLIGYGLLLLATSRENSLSGLAILAIGAILAAHYGAFERSAKLKVTALITAVVLAIASQAFRSLIHLGTQQTLIGFAYTSVAVVGLAYLYVIVLRDAASSAAARQSELERTVRQRTRLLNEEVAARDAAEVAARKSAVESQRLAAERLELLREVHHRAKNSLQMTLSLLEGSPPGNMAEYETTIARIRAIGLAYDVVDESTDLGAIVLEEYVERLLLQVQMSAGSSTISLSYTRKGPTTTRLEPTVNLGLLLLELIRIVRGCPMRDCPTCITIRQSSNDHAVVFAIEHTAGALPREADPIAGDSALLGLLPAFLERLAASLVLHDDQPGSWLLEVPRERIEHNYDLLISGRDTEKHHTG
ncbi:MAG: histidine kinase dimerization/phosphoacceptor domain -containing protein [Spirochaetota bacterium]